MSTGIYNGLLVLMACFLSTLVWAQSPTAKAELNQATLLIGQQVNITLEVEADQNESVQWPSIPDTLGKIEVVSSTAIDTTLRGGRTIYDQVITITSFDTGYFAIPPFEFQVGPEVIETDAFLLEVRTVELDSADQIVDIKQPLTVHVSLWELVREWLKRNWPYLAGSAGGALLISAVILFFVLRKKETILAKPEVPRLPPHVEALQKLHALDDHHLWQSGKIKAYYSELTDILREYLERRYDINALELTTDEILSNLSGTDLSEESKGFLTGLLQQSDLVKFAKASPGLADNERSMPDAIAFIEQTKLVEETQAPETSTENSEDETA